MKLKLSKNSAPKMVQRLKKKASIRRRVTGTAERPRLCIFRSAKHIYAQVINDVTGATIVSASTLDVEGLKNANKDTAKAIGQEVAKRAKAKNIDAVVFDRNGFLYHGRVKALADGAREAGLNF
jgi:large subunit ribosomal protein L18